MKTIRIFISSPGDVAEERERARQVIESLRRRYASVFHLKPVLWEELPLQADMSFQQGIDLVLSADHGIDIAVFILWSRLGSPLGARVRKPDGSPYLSGTEREFDLMLQARAQGGGERPAFLVYTRRDETSFEERLRGKPTSEKEDLIQQKKLVERFIGEEFHESGSGHNLRAYHSFDRPQTFSQRLRAHLVELLDALAGDQVREVVWDIETQGAPFMGLDPFGEKQTAVFCGRDAEILEARRALVAQAREGRAFLLITGASGSGKSSLARAGLLPAIAEHELDETVAAWLPCTLTPSELGAKPLMGLVVRLAAPDLLPGLRAAGSSLEDVAKLLAKDPESAVNLLFKRALAEASAKRGGGVRLLLLVDQLEEIFAMAARETFLGALEALAASGVCWVVATVRGDFLGEVQQSATLVRLIAGHGLFPVLAPDADALRHMIEEPARLAGLRFEEKDDRRLSDRILADAAKHADLLPLVEFVLLRLYDQRSAEGMLTWQAYEALGGVEGALARQADEVLGRLPVGVQATLPSVLKRLVTLSEAGGGAEDGSERLIRQRVALAAFPPESEARRLVEAFVAGRLFTASAEAGGEASVTLAHEALLRVWPVAATWAVQNNEILRTRARVAARMRESDRIAEGDPLLEAAKAHLATDPEAFTEAQRAFIEGSFRAAEERQQRREKTRRLVMVTMAILTLVALAGAGIAWVKQREAKVAEARAEDRERKATAMLLLNQADQAEKAGNSDLARSYLMRSLQSQPTPAARSALLNNFRRSPHAHALIALGGGGVSAIAWNEDSSVVAAGLRSGAIFFVQPDGSANQLAAGTDQFNGVLDLVFATKTTVFSLHESGELVSNSTLERSVKDSTSTQLLAGAISPDAKQYIGSGRMNVLREVKAGNNGFVETGELPRGLLGALRFSTDSRLMAFAVESGFAGYLDRSHNIIQERRSADGKLVLSSAWDSKGGALAFGIAGLGVEIWQSQGRPAPLVKIPCSDENITSLDWAPDGALLVGAINRRLQLWLYDGTTITEKKLHATHQSTINTVRWSSDGRFLASGDDNGVLKFWTRHRTGPVRIIEAPAELHGLAASPDGRKLAVGTHNGQCLVFDTTTGNVEAELSAGTSPIQAIAWNPDGSSFALANQSGVVRLVRSPFQGSMVLSDYGHSIWQLAWSPDGHSLYATTADGSLHRWKSTEPTTKTLIQVEGDLLGLALSPDGRRVAVGDTTGIITILHTDDGKLERSQKVHADSIGSIAWSKENSWIATVGNDGNLALVDPNHKTNPILLGADDSETTRPYLEAVCFSPDGSQVATAGQNGVVQVWNIEDRAIDWEVAMHDAAVWQLCWTDAHLYSSSSDSRVGLIETDKTKWLDSAKKQKYLLKQNQ